MYKILVADDEPIERAVVKKIIDAGLTDQVEVFTAINGREAVEIFNREKCDIALLDIAMPGINGLDAAIQIRKDCPKAIIVFLTAFDEFDYARRAIQVRALEYLLKPVDEQELLTVIEEGIHILNEDRLPKQIGTSVYDDSDDRLDGRQAAIKKQILIYLEEHYADDISLADIAESMNYSEVYFSKVFKNFFNKGFIIYLTEMRIEKSKLLLADVTVNIKDICNKVGFRDSNYYTKVFKRMVGMTPSEYRAMRG